MTSRILYFIRHGETAWNAERRLQGQHDIPLNALGRKQAAHCGGLLLDLVASGHRTMGDFDFVSSPLSRARETMEIIRAELGLPHEGYVIDRRLAELSFGKWEGLTYKEVRAQDHNILATRDRDRWNFAPPGGESYADLMARVRPWLDGLMGDTIVTAHGGVARVLMVLFGVRAPAEATLGDVGQGIVLEFGPRAMNRYA